MEALRRVHRELRDLSDAELTRLGQGDARSLEVVRIDREVTARLRSRRYDETDLMTAAVDHVAPPHPLDPLYPPDAGGFEHVVLHLPQRLSAPAPGCSSPWPSTVRSPSLLGLSGDRRGRRRREQVLDRLGVAEPPIDAALPPGAPAAASRRPLGSSASSPPTRTTRCAPPCAALLLAAEEGTPLERMVIVYGPSGGYGRLLADHLTAARLPWNGVADVPLAERVAGRTLLGLLALDPVASPPS